MNMSGRLLFLAAALCLAQPVAAEPIQPNGDLVMRLIFEDCLGYIRHGRQPFTGLETRQASPEALQGLHSPATSRAGTVQLLSPRYVADWGSDASASFCMIQTVRDDKGEPISPSGHLGVEPKGFIGRVTERAVREGFTERDVGEELSPLFISTWRQPDNGQEIGPESPIRFVIMPTGEDDANGLVDAGLIVMRGPPRSH
ncbi:hypothetical protein [Terrihabitans sp. B22-R8]|uniref:hypothetical protein n=1 Tax=Terrihabitans sp. B22-R8 TaxID=3425128 RepID=UPI00403C238A